MKKSLVSVFCFFLCILSSPYAQTAKEPKVITINSVRMMEVFKKENKAQYRTKSDKNGEKKGTNSSEDKTEQVEKKDAGEKQSPAMPNTDLSAGNAEPTAVSADSAAGGSSGAGSSAGALAHTGFAAAGVAAVGAAALAGGIILVVIRRRSSSR